MSLFSSAMLAKGNDKKPDNKVFHSISKVEEEYFPNFHREKTLWEKINACDDLPFSFVHETSAGVCPICGKEMVKHIIKEGAWYHVLRWNTHGTSCSNKDCEINHGCGNCMGEG